MKLRRPFCLAVGGAGGLSVVAKEKKRACACCDDDDGIFGIIIIFFPRRFERVSVFYSSFSKDRQRERALFQNFSLSSFQKCH